MVMIDLSAKEALISLQTYFSPKSEGQLKWNFILDNLHMTILSISHDQKCTVFHFMLDKNYSKNLSLKLKGQSPLVLPYARLPNARMLNIWLNIKNNCSMKQMKKIRECHATAYGFLRLWYTYELRKYSH